jgi:hypothetical protein
MSGCLGQPLKISCETLLAGIRGPGRGAHVHNLQLTHSTSTLYVAKGINFVTQ